MNSKTHIARFINKKIPASLWLILALLVLITIIYIPVFQNGLTNWDDDLYILHNPYLKSLSLTGLKNTISSYYAGNYHPLTLISLAIDYQTGGNEPWPYQLTNLILHLCNTILVYVLVLQLLKKLSTSSNITIAAFITAGFFGIHTLQVESVAWISERKNVLYTFFFLLSLIAYLKYVTKNQLLSESASDSGLYQNLSGSKNWRKKYYYISLLFFIFSLLSKGMAVPLTLCVILIDFFLKRNLTSRNVLLEKIPFILLSLVFGFIAIKAQHSAEAMRITENYTLTDRIAFASYGFIQYLVKLCYPYNLSAFYPYPIKTGSTLAFTYYLYIGLVFVLLVLLFAFFRRNKIVLFGSLFYISNISLVIQLLPVGDAIMADRYIYVPSIGFFMIIGYYSALLLSKNNAFKISTLVILIIYSAFIGYKTNRRVMVWKDSFTLWNDAIDKYPVNNTRGYLNRGSLFYEMGNYPLALMDYNQLLNIDPQNAGAYIGKGLVKQSLNDYKGAMSDYNKGLSIQPLYEGYLNRAILKMNMQNLDNALKDLEYAIKINSYRPDAYINKAYIYFQTAKYDEALQDYNTAISLDPLNSVAYRGRGQTKQALEDLEGALNDYNTAISLQPLYDYYLNRSVVKYFLNDIPGSLKDLDDACVLNPERFEAFYNKGYLFLITNRNENAVEEFNKALEIKSSDYEIYLNRGIAKYNLNNYGESVVDLDSSININPTADGFYYRGICFVKMNNMTEGCSDLRKAVKLGNNDAKEKINEFCK